MQGCQQEERQAAISRTDRQSLTGTPQGVTAMSNRPVRYDIHSISAAKESLLRLFELYTAPYIPA